MILSLALSDGYTVQCMTCARVWAERTCQRPGAVRIRYLVPEIINHPYHHHQLTSSNSNSGSLLLVVMGAAVVVVAAADCGGGGDGHQYAAVVLVAGVKFYLVRTWYQVQGFCADAYRIIMKKAVSQDYCTITEVYSWVNVFASANSSKKFRHSTNHFRDQTGGIHRGGYTETKKIKFTTPPAKSSRNPSPLVCFTLSPFLGLLLLLA